MTTQLLKIALIGDAYVGKTCLINRYTEDEFNEVQPTIGAQFKIKNVEKDDVSYKVQIYDTAGQEMYDSVTSSYYRLLNGIVVVFDITNKKSFQNVSSWIEKFKKVADDQNNNIVIFGNKSDLESKRDVSSEDITSFIKSKELEYFEVSALSGENVDDAFDSIIKIIYDRMQSESSPSKKKLNALDINSNESYKKQCC